MRRNDIFHADNLSFRQLLDQLCWWPSDVARLAGVSLRSAKRYWQHDQAPLAVRRLLWLHRTGLPDFGGWQEMRIDADGILHTATGQKLSAGQINAVYWFDSRIRMLQDALHEKSAAVALLEAEMKHRHFLMTPANEQFCDHSQNQLHLL